MSKLNVTALDQHQATYGLMALLCAQFHWSEETFGPAGRRSGAGPMQHLQREIHEYLESNRDIEELADCFLLLLDVTWRDQHSAEDLVDAMFDKMIKNSKRTWPSTPDKDGVFEHVKEAV